MTKICIATDNGNVAAHFGRCPGYTIVDIENSEVIKKEEIKNPGHSTGYIPKYLSDLGVEHMISGGMGRRAVDLFNQYNILTSVGVSGSISECIESLKSGSLKSGVSTCSPGRGKGYGIPKADGHGL